MSNSKFLKNRINTLFGKKKVIKQAKTTSSFKGQVKAQKDMNYSIFQNVRYIKMRARKQNMIREYIFACFSDQKVFQNKQILDKNKPELTSNFDNDEESQFVNIDSQIQKGIKTIHNETNIIKSEAFISNLLKEQKIIYTRNKLINNKKILN